MPESFLCGFEVLLFNSHCEDFLHCTYSCCCTYILSKSPAHSARYTVSTSAGCLLVFPEYFVWVNTEFHGKAHLSGICTQVPVCCNTGCFKSNVPYLASFFYKQGDFYWKGVIWFVSHVIVNNLTSGNTAHVFFSGK